MDWSANEDLVASTRKHRRRRDGPPAEDEGASKRTKTGEGLRRIKITVPLALAALPSLPPAPPASSWAIVPYVPRPVPRPVTVPPGGEPREEGEEEAMQVD